MQRQVRRRIERGEKTKAKAATQKTIDKKWIYLIACALVAIVVIVTSIAAYRDIDWTVARIDGTRIRQSDMNHEVFNAQQVLITEYFAMFPEDFVIDYNRLFRDGLTFGDYIRREAAINLAVSFLLVEEAERLGVSLTEADRRDIQRDIMERWGTDLSELHGVGITTHQQLTNIFERMQIRSNVFEALLHELDEEERFNKAVELDAIWAAQHILVGIEPTGIHTPEEASELAWDLHARIMAGEDFEALMLIYSDDQNPDEPPDTYTFTAGFMVPEFENATRALAIGEVSDPIRSGFGYHIIRRAEPDPNPYPHGIMGDVGDAIGNVLIEQFYLDARDRIEILTAIDRVAVE